jgi:hypothetical protein
VSGAQRLELKSSPALAALIITAHGAAAFAAYFALPGVMAALLAAALVMLGLAAAWSRALLRNPGSVRALEIGAGQPIVELADGERFAAEVARRHYVSRFLVILPLVSPSRRTLLVTGDMLAAEEFRRLRIWTLWNRLPAENRAVAAKQLPA